MQLYLYANALLYFIFSVLCLVKLSGTSNFLGYGFLNNSGRVEYLTIYTGLQIGFAVFLGLAAWNVNFRLAGMVFCVILYAGIIITRTVSGAYFGDLAKATYMVGALEYTLFIWGAIVLYNQLKG